jgi:hypothetical protein
MDTLTKIKQAIRRTHGKLDDDLQADIDACLADLRSVGIIYADDADPLIYNAIKLWCRSLDTDDTVKAAEYMKRYDALKASLMMAEGYGRPVEAADE